MATASYITRKGDCLDLVCLKYYGRSDSETIQRVVEFNYWLREQPPILPSGIEIKLPDLPKPQPETITIW